MPTHWFIVYSFPDYPVQEPQTLLSSANSVLPNPVPLTQEWPQLKKPTLQASIAQSQPDLSVSSTHEVSCHHGDVIKSHICGVMELSYLWGCGGA